MTGDVECSRRYRVARKPFHFDVLSGQYVARPSASTAVVSKPIVRTFGGKLEYGCTQLDPAAFLPGGQGGA